MAESGGAAGIRGNKRLKLKLKKEKDRLSALPDSLIQHILSFLPSTKEAIRASVLSKRWLHQWTHVPNLIFDFSGIYPDQSISITTSNVSKIIDNALISHDCNRIEKFHFIAEDNYYYDCNYDPNYDTKLRFAVRKQVEDLSLRFWIDDEKFRLPSFFFSQPCLVNLQLEGFSVMPLGIVNWGSLKDLCLEHCYCDDQAIISIVSGCPMLESLELDDCYEIKTLVANSKSLKRIVLLDIDSYLDISCPNLVEFEFVATHAEGFVWPKKVLKKIMSNCPLLESLKLVNCEFPKLRIDSENLKKLLLRGVVSGRIEISCPKLEELDLSKLNTETIKLKNLPSSICASLDFGTSRYGWKFCKENVAKQIIKQLQHLNELKLGSSFIGTLCALEMEGLYNPLLNRKSLTLEDPSIEHLPGIVCALRSSLALERLVVKLQPHKNQKLANLSDMDNPGDNYWKSNGVSFRNLVSHLRTVEIIGLSQREDKPKLVLGFVEFLLKNATVLEKVVVILEDCRTDFVVKVSQKLLSFPRCSDAIVELLCSN